MEVHPSANGGIPPNVILVSLFVLLFVVNPTAVPLIHTAGRTRATWPRRPPVAGNQDLSSVGEYPYKG